MGRVEGGKKCGQDVKQLNKLTKKKTNKHHNSPSLGFKLLFKKVEISGF